MSLSKRGLSGGHNLAIAVLGFLAGLGAEAQGFTKIADLNTAVPGGGGTFATLTQPQIHMGNVVFGGAGSNASGIYRFDPATGERSIVVNTTGGLPGGGSPLLNAFSVYGNDVSLMGFSVSSDFGLYTTRGGTLHKVPGSDALSLFQIAPTSMDGQRILFHREFNRMTGQTPMREPGFAVVNAAETISNGGGQTPVYKFIARDGGYAYSDHFRYSGTKGNYRIGSSNGELWWFADGSFNNTLWPSHSYDGDTLAFFAQASSTSDLANSVTQKGIYTPGTPQGGCKRSSTMTRPSQAGRGRSRRLPMSQSTTATSCSSAALRPARRGSSPPQTVTWPR
jgi:hypothetical protein